MKDKTRHIKRVVSARYQREGAGFLVRRPFPGVGFSFMDPFLLLDELGPVTYKSCEALGAPDHPHRGFETVTYLLQGEFEHKDSAGHQGVLRAGDVQWMTAGSGVVHSEMPSQSFFESGGVMHGFQVWINLPSSLKMTKPTYQEISNADIPHAFSKDRLASVRVLAGQALGVQAIINTHVPIQYHDWTFRPGADIRIDVQVGHNIGIYVFSGRVRVGESLDLLETGQFAVLDEGGRVRFVLPSEEFSDARVLLLSGLPINEPIARYGPFVMSTEEELQQAFIDYKNGRMGLINPEVV